MLNNILAIGAIVLLSATSSMAQQMVAKQCAADIKSLCAGVEPGEGRIRACLKLHVNDLSAPCQAALAKAAAIGKVCGVDIKKICADVKPGSGRIVACLKSHLTEVSEPCKDAMTHAGAGEN